jgi:hypothetical protein
MSAARFCIEYRAPRHTKWHRLSVTARVPFTEAELAKYAQMIAERITYERGMAVMAGEIRIRTREVSA